MLNTNPFSWVLLRVRSSWGAGSGWWVGGGGLLAATSGIAATGRESVPSESVRLLQPELQYWAVSTQNDLHTKA